LNTAGFHSSAIHEYRQTVGTPVGNCFERRRLRRGRNEDFDAAMSALRTMSNIRRISRPGKTKVATMLRGSLMNGDQIKGAAKDVAGKSNRRLES